MDWFKHGQDLAASYRTGAGFMLAGFAIAILLAPWIIKDLKRLSFGQHISADGPESHAAKEGTPTMGGWIFIPALFLQLLPGLWNAKRFVLSLGALILSLLYAILGCIDDYLTIRPKGNIRGISSKPKALLQFVLAAIFVIWLGASRPPQENVLMIGSYPLLSGVTYYIFAVVFIVGMSNFVNITDGLDGLAAGLTLICCLAYAFVLPLLDMASEAVMIYALTGGVLAFLWYNTNPAKIFMGDTGSLAIGSLLPAIALLTHTEVILIIFAAIFILDGLSSALQWMVFKYTRIKTGTGRRIFRKSPIHHHFELCGHAEQAIVVRFWILGAIFAVVGVLYALNSISVPEYIGAFSRNHLGCFWGGANGF